MTSDRLFQRETAAEYDPSQPVRVSIVLEKPSAVQAGYATMKIGANTEAVRYRAQLLAAQNKMARTISARALQGQPLDVVWNMTLVGNIISAWVPYGALETIAAIPGIRAVTMEAQYEPAAAERRTGVTPDTYQSSGMIGSVWGSNPVSGGGSDQYETMSGTSMAAPQVTGMAALLAQVIREWELSEVTGLSPRHLAQSLLMSTAKPLFEAAAGGSYYPLLRQGAGLARVDLAAQAESFVLVPGQDDCKVKAELGDDPRRTGVYEFDFTITNITGSDAVYTLDADLFRQDVFEYLPGSGIWLPDNQTTDLPADVTFCSDSMIPQSTADHDLNGDGRTNAADADHLLEYAVGNKTELHAQGDLSGDGLINSYDAHLLLASLGGDSVTVPAGDTVTVSVRMALTAEAMEKLDAETPNGTYVQAFVYARSVAREDGHATEHSIPVLAFYGDWSDAAGKPLAEGTQVQVTLTAVPHYYRQPDGSYSYEGLGSGTSLTTSFTIDNTAPEALDIDLSRFDEDRLTVRARDNRHVAAVALLNANGTRKMCAASPNQTEPGREVTVEPDLSSAYGKEFLVAVYDYANNVTTYRVEMDLGAMERDYFTAIDYVSMTYVGVDRNGQTSFLADLDLPSLPRAAEYVGGYVFIITDDSSLCVASDKDLSITQRISPLDPTDRLQITFCNDLAYNYADGRLYVQYYSNLNREMRPYLAVINMDDGTLEPVCELPQDVNTMAIDSQGNFYSAAYDSSLLYTYTLSQVTGTYPTMTQVGYMEDYKSSYLSNMAWDHNGGRLYWAYPNKLLQIDPKTAAVTIHSEQEEAMLLGLYTRPEQSEGRFDPVDRVDRVVLSHSDIRVVLNNGANLEATVWPWYAADRSVTWSSSDERIATVDENGRVTATGLGRCVITAVSNLDPGKSASCTVSTFRHEKTLQAIIWDESGEVYLSRFDTQTIPQYTKLTEKGLGIDLAAATVGQDGSIYAASLQLDTMRSELYKLDPETFAVTRIGPSPDAYVDLAPAPGQPGNSLMAVFGGNVLNVDAETGDYYNWYYMFANNLVGIAYVGTQEYKYGKYDTMVDWYFIIDRMGYVYLMGFLEQDGKYYYLEQEILAPRGIYTKLDFEMETQYFGSAYFDGEMLYFSAYRRSRNDVTPMAIDVAGGSRTCYELGTFADGVWPVAGLMESGELRNHIGIITGAQGIQALSQPRPVEQPTQTKGGLHSAAVPMSFPEVGTDRVQVDVTLPTAGTNAADNPFTDVNEDDYFFKAVLWALEKGITNGMDATHFGPTQNCSRAQVVTFLYRTLAK